MSDICLCERYPTCPVDKSGAAAYDLCPMYETSDAPLNPTSELTASMKEALRRKEAGESPPAHNQVETPGGVWVDEGMVVLLSAVWAKGMSTLSSCQGGGATQESALAFIVFGDLGDAAEFMTHVNLITDYRFGDNLALTLHRPQSGHQPQGKVTWLPEMTSLIMGRWS